MRLRLDLGVPLVKILARLDLLATRPRYFKWLCFLTILAALSLRLPRLSTISMWGDEYYTVKIVRLPFAQILSGQYTGDLNPPLYYLLLKLYLQMTGETEIAMRSFSLIVSVLSLILFLRVAWELSPEPIPSLGALLLMSFHPMFIYYSTEIRVYAFLVFVTLLSFLSYFRFRAQLRNRVGWAALLVIGLASCLYTHYFGLLVPLAVMAFVFVDWTADRSRLHFKSAALVLSSGFVYFPGGLFLLVKQVAGAQAVGQSGLVSPSKFLQIFTFSFHAPGYEPLIPIIALVAFAAGGWLWIKQDKRTGYSLGLAIAGSVGAALLAFQMGIRIFPRFFLHAVPLVLLVIAKTLTTRRLIGMQRAIHSVGWLLILLYILYGLEFAHLTPQENALAKFKADWKYVSEVVRGVQRSDEPLVIMGWDATPIQYYLGQSGMTSFDLEKELSQGPRCSYLVVLSAHSRYLAVLDQAVTLYQDDVEQVRIVRLTTEQCF